ncbi:hypothetical protein PIIN_06682 [Serendipita indica DSM 11827]|uniref:ubiquitinyl hydrolase 1 n=1 Tax=Serendipita indica (strain DSM 11827) TaxID=1109443 RepID=G4TN51_SERID|nr:hypothetical protein PIIN_06682 [Serendipita indica DSM 11827]
MASNTDASNEQNEGSDLITSPWGVVESDPYVFTSMIQRLGALDLQTEELMSLDALETTTSPPLGLILCFTWTEDSYNWEDYDNEDLDPSALPWFATQLSHNSCATLAILNVLLNCDTDLGPMLSQLKEFSGDMEPVMRGLCITSSKELRDIHNSFSRPADIRASLVKTVEEVLDHHKSQSITKRKGKKKKERYVVESPDAYHFLSYVPHGTRVWEMDGLKRAPLECAELDNPGDLWTLAVLPALRSRIEALSKSGDIRFTLLAIKPSAYTVAIEEFELVKRQIGALERRLVQTHGEHWIQMVAPSAMFSRQTAFSRAWNPRIRVGFASRANDAAMQILKMSPETLLDEWAGAIGRLKSWESNVQEVIDRDMVETTEHISRTHDYDPFIQQYVSVVYNMGILQDLLEVDGLGRPRQSTA